MMRELFVVPVAAYKNRTHACHLQWHCWEMQSHMYNVYIVERYGWALENLINVLICAVQRSTPCSNKPMIRYTNTHTLIKNGIMQRALVVWRTSDLLLSDLYR